nr:MAG TPA: hypothetical protein [Caudoviricetes sp.]
MTKEDIKEALKTCGAINSLCVNCPYKNVENCYDTLNLDARELIIEQEKSIQVAQDNILSLAQQNQEYREQQVKQAKIDVLKELKKRARTSYVLDDFILGSVVFSKDIDELIKEVEEQ